MPNNAPLVTKCAHGLGRGVHHAPPPPPPPYSYKTMFFGTLMNMDKYFMWIHYERLHNHNKAKHNKTVCIFLGVYFSRGDDGVATGLWLKSLGGRDTVYPKKYAHGFVVLCFVVMQSFIMNSHEVFIHIHQGCFAGTGAIVRLPQCQWSKPDGYGKISQCITTTKHSKAKTVCIFLGIYCSAEMRRHVISSTAHSPVLS